MAHLKDIAHVCGVSIRTVSRALKGDGYVSQDVKVRVLSEAKRLGYRPHRIARSLKTQRSYEVAVIVWNVDELHMAKIAGLEQRLRTCGYAVHMVFSRRDPEAPTLHNGLVQELLQWRPAAVAAFPGGGMHLGEAVEALTEHGVPSVAFDSHEPGVDSIRVDRPQGVREAVHYLARQGHERIAYLGRAEDRSRLEGYRAAMQDLGREPQLVELESVRARYEGGRKAAAAFAALKNRPDAVQAYTDETAMGFIAGLQALDVRVPEDVAVVGFDDRQAAAWASPPLTTVAQPNQEVGEAAADVLIQKINQAPQPPSGWTRAIPTRLVVRESA